MAMLPSSAEEGLGVVGESAETPSKRLLYES